MNIFEIEERIHNLQKRTELIAKDLKDFALSLSPASQVAMIARIVQTQAEIKEYEDMLDFIKFDDIVKKEFGNE